LYAGALLLLSNERWWMVSVIAFVFSQVLIKSSWHDARFGIGEQGLAR